MKKMLAAVLVLSASPLLAQQTGVSNPPDANVEEVSSAPAIAQPAVPATSASSLTAASVSVPSRPAAETAPVQCPASVAAAPSMDTAPVLRTREADSDTMADSGIVTEVPQSDHELITGTQLRARLEQPLSTKVTGEGTPFTATLTENVTNRGRVIFPRGAQVQGRITQARSGHRIHGTALLHLEVNSVVMPDGTRIPVHAAVIDTDQWDATRVDDEGNIVHRTYTRDTLVTTSAITGGAAAVGAIAGAAPGAVIGAVVGAGASAVWWLNKDRQEHLPENTVLTLMLTEPYEFAPDAMPATAISEINRPAAVQAPSAMQPQAFVPTN